MFSIFKKYFQCVLAARILTVDFVVCTLAVKNKSGQVSICRIGPFPCESDLTLRPTVSRPVCPGIKHPSWAYDQIFITVRHLWVCWCGLLSLTRGWVCHLQLLLALASAVILGSKSHGTLDHFYCLRFETSLFIASYDFALLQWRYLTSPGLGSLFYIVSADPTENTVSIIIAQQYHDCCLVICCRGKLFTKLLPSSECLLWLCYSGFQVSCDCIHQWEKRFEWKVVVVSETYFMPNKCSFFI
jgi:hypothetical protein